MKKNKYLAELSANGLDECLEQLANDGFCPAILNDDNGHWALVFDGVQTIDTKKSDWSGSYFVEKKYWKNSVLEAVRYSIASL